MRNLDTRLLQLDEIWGFIDRSRRMRPPRIGAKEWAMSGRSLRSMLRAPWFPLIWSPAHAANMMLWRSVTTLSRRINNRVQVSTDSLASYAAAIERGFGCEADYGQIVKVHGENDLNESRRYIPAKLVKVERKAVSGKSNEDLISTSYVERQNLTMRMHMRRLTRLTNAFSKKFENFRAAVALHFTHYNFVRLHSTLRMTPAMAEA